MRNSVEKLTKKISQDSEAEDKPIYLKEETVGVVISKTTGDDTSFTVSGDDTDYTRTDIADDTKPVLFSVKVADFPVCLSRHYMHDLNDDVFTLHLSADKRMIHTSILKAFYKTISYQLDVYTPPTADNRYSNKLTLLPCTLQVKVPADEKKSAVTAILYDTPKFYPDNETVEDFTSALAQQFTSPLRSKKVVNTMSYKL